MDNPVLELLSSKKIFPITCLEIGVRFGNTFKNIIDRYPNIDYYGIDPYQHFDKSEYDYEAPSNVKQKDQDDIYKKTKSIFDYYGKSLIRLTASMAVDQIPDNLDFIFIDGNHSYLHVKNDICNYYSKLKVGGILIVHDCKEATPGVQKAINDCGIRSDGIHNSSWWTIKKNIYKDSNTFNIVGLARTGHHAIIEWMIRSIGKGVYFNNCQINVYPNVGVKYDYFSDIDDNIFHIVRLKNTTSNYLNEFGIDPKHRPVFYEYMNVNVDCLFRMNSNCNNYLVIRDIYNFIASSLKRKIATPKKVEMWKEHCKYGLNNLSSLIKYNDWVSNYEYRNKIAKVFSDESIECDKQSIIGKSVFGDKKAVLERYCGYLHNNDFWNLIDEECEELNRQMFGFYINKDIRKRIDVT